MKRASKKEKRHPSSGLKLSRAKVWADKKLYLDTANNAWQHSYCDRLAWKLINEGEEWLVCLAYFVLLFRKRRIDVDAKEVARYYMARAQVRLANESE